MRDAVVIGSFVLLSCAGTVACYGLNPDYMPPDPLAEETGESDGSTLTDTSGGASTEASSGEMSTETETGPAPAFCGDGFIDPGEQCDDGNEANDDGCLFNCRIPMTCAEILELAPDAPDGTYLVDPRGTGEPWPVACDMSFEGGGWTGFAVTDTCDSHLASTITSILPAQSEGLDESCRPFTSYVEGGSLGYVWDIEFPPGFEAFFVRGYAVKSIGTPDLGFAQLLWTEPADFPNGAVSLGDAYAEGPLTTWVSAGGAVDPFVADEVRAYPAQDHSFALGQMSDTLRIGWGEWGIETEGLFPWWSGRIFVR